MAERTVVAFAFHMTRVNLEETLWTLGFMALTTYRESRSLELIPQVGLQVHALRPTA